MLAFKEMLGYAFRKHVAQAIELDAAQHIKADSNPSIAVEVAQLPWTGESPFDRFASACPIDFIVWLCSIDGTKIKIRSGLDIARNHERIWYLGSIVDIWLKTPILTFNRAFPDEINVFSPHLCSLACLRDHLKLAQLVGMSAAFEEAFLTGVPPEDRLQAESLLEEAKH